MFITGEVKNYISKLGSFREYIKDNKGFIAGGMFKNIFMKEKVRDIDIFFNCEEDFLDALIQYSNDPRFKPSYKNDNCEAFLDTKNGILVELIKSQHYPVEEMISRFDFTIAKMAMYKVENSDSVQYNIVYHPLFFEHLHNKRLVIDDGMVDPVSTFNRVLKYTGYGFGLCYGSKIKLIEQIIENGNIDSISSQLYFGFD